MEPTQTFNVVALAEVRKGLTARLVRSWNFTEADLAPRSLYQLVTLIHLLAGHRNYVGQHTVVLHARTNIW